MNICFAADASLGKLVKWLRIMGLDTRYLNEVHRDDDLIVLTRTRQVLKTHKGRRTIFITSNHPLEQTGEVIRSVGLIERDIAPFSRCLRCNSKIEKIDKAHVKGKVPDYIWETHDVFKTCRRCDKIFWPGSHMQRSMEMIHALFEVFGSPPRQS